jgi:hypothetical protein
VDESERVSSATEWCREGGGRRDGRTTSRLGEPGRRTGCQDSGGVGLAGRVGDRMSERVLERAGAAWEEQRGAAHSL